MAVPDYIATIQRYIIQYYTVAVSLALAAWRSCWERFRLRSRRRRWNDARNVCRDSIRY